MRATFLDNAQIMNVDGDLKLRLVKMHPYNKRVQVYGIAGVSYNRFKNILENNGGTVECRRRARDATACSSTPTDNDVAQRLGLAYGRRPRARVGRHQPVHRVAVLALQR